MSAVETVRAYLKGLGALAQPLGEHEAVDGVFDGEVTREITVADLRSLVAQAEALALVAPMTAEGIEIGDLDPASGHSPSEG